ncbi:hypothetical protein A3A93_06430 [Candidatus Roizmanbacteria bacterium RIFCSPLOWO2_01_FULL_38_12]|uniref:Polysaccharide biosynthesis protein C-terminal domain-containing protein n=2 Tax=Candidatus Roizmaniibacteriota TaxID=1752723 RepID=A0A1F7HIH4_9BACT|nr:MAG: hypothetical protein A3F29_03360 [Candidatus Roizmanbacteria bacterium RIFCSPHIGHO2_12_FULL_33_9]OGK46864.1 MAG: hypothetical protein A3A93_06430 [Candidatus Roizmanbacteria bacterium RIFCSPLOWO2_01_FULL_38_12]
MKDLYIFIKSQKFLKSSFFYWVASMICGIMNYFFNSYVGKALGPNGFGDITTLFSYVIVLSIPTGIIGTFLIIKIGDKLKNHGYARSLFLWYINLLKNRWYLLALVFLLSPFVAPLTGLPQTVAYFLIPILIINWIIAYYNSLLQGLHLLSTIAIVGLLMTAIKLAGGLSAFFFHQGILIILVSLFAGFVVNLLISHFVLSRFLAKAKMVSINFQKKLLTLHKDKHIWLTIASTIAVGLLGNIDIIVAKRLFSAENVGFYSAWLLFGKIILYIFGPILSIAFIFFSSRKYKKFHRPGFIFTIFIFALIGIVAYFGYDMFALTAVNLVFGHKFLPVAPYLDVAAIYGTCYLLVFFTHQFFLAKGSWGVLILPIFSVIYIGVILFAAKSIVILMMITVGFLALVFGSSLIFYLLRKNVIFSE